MPLPLIIIRHQACDCSYGLPLVLCAGCTHCASGSGAHDSLRDASPGGWIGWAEQCDCRSLDQDSIGIIRLGKALGDVMSPHGRACFPVSVSVSVFALLFVVRPGS